MKSPGIIVRDIFNPMSLHGALLYAAIVLCVAWILAKLIEVSIHRYLDKAEATGADSTSVRFLGELGKLVIYIIALFCYVEIIPALQSFSTAWLASIGVVSVVIGLATQSTLSNLISGISLILYQPFHLGDRIQVIAPTGNETGVVERIDLGYTTLRGQGGKRIVIPNSLIASQTNINYSHRTAHILAEITITVANGAGIDHAMQILQGVGKDIRKVTKVNGCFVTSLTGNGAVIMLSIICQDPADIASIKSDVLQAAKKQFDAAGIALL
jgi:small conductance mechanosensitive channel